MSNLRTELAQIYRDHGELYPQLVVDVARAVDHPLHDRFEWDDTVAGECWRRVQAHKMIRFVKVETINEAGGVTRTREWVAVQKEVPTPRYMPVVDVLQNPLERQRFFARMERDIAWLVTRYRNVEEFWATLRSEVEQRSA